MLDLMDDFGFDEVLLETVGVGQAEYAARVQVDTLVLVLLPESGDIVQAMKAGIMEMADIFVVNKADLPGAQKMATDIKRISAHGAACAGRLACRRCCWRRPRSRHRSPRSRHAIDRHQAWLADGAARQSPACSSARATGCAG